MELTPKSVLHSNMPPKLPALIIIIVVFCIVSVAVPGEALLRQRLREGTGPFLREVVPFHANKFSVKSGWKDKES